MKDNALLHRSWTSIFEFYHERQTDIGGYQCAIDALEKLSFAISRSHLNRQLFAHTSHDRLMISQTKSTYPPPAGSSFLVIEPRVEGDLQLSMEYWGAKHREKDKEWARLTEAKDLHAQFNKLIRQLCWNYHPISEQR